MRLYYSHQSCKGSLRTELQRHINPVIKALMVRIWNRVLCKHQSEIFFCRTWSYIQLSTVRLLSYGLGHHQKRKISTQNSWFHGHEKATEDPLVEIQKMRRNYGTGLKSSERDTDTMTFKDQLTMSSSAPEADSQVHLKAFLDRRTILRVNGFGTPYQGL